MKAKFTIQVLMMLLFALTAYAQQGINYKAIIHDSDGDVLVTTPVTVQFTILENGTTNVYQEIHSPTTDDKGIIIVNIGEGSLISGDFTTIDWGNNPHFLKTEIDVGNGMTDMGTTEFKAVPYSLFASVADSVSGPITETQNLADVIALNNSANSQIKNLTNPTDFQDAATKAYVDVASPCDSLFALIDSLYKELYTSINKSGAYTALLDPPVVIDCESYVDGPPTTFISLTWAITDPLAGEFGQGRDLISDVYFQTPDSTMKFSNILDPSLIITESSFIPGLYYWQVIVKDYFNNITIGPLMTIDIL